MIGVLIRTHRVQEMSQRDPGGPVQLVIGRAEANLRQLLHVPDNYKVLFFQVGVSSVACRAITTASSSFPPTLVSGLQGGAHAQFAALPLNLFGKHPFLLAFVCSSARRQAPAHLTGCMEHPTLTHTAISGHKAKAVYAGQGVWNSKAAAEARKYGEVQTPAGSAATPDGRYPPVEQWYVKLLSLHQMAQILLLSSNTQCIIMQLHECCDFPLSISFPTPHKMTCNAAF